MTIVFVDDYETPDDTDLKPCVDCGTPTWYARCDECFSRQQEAYE